MSTDKFFLLSRFRKLISLKDYIYFSKNNNNKLDYINRLYKLYTGTEKHNKSRIVSRTLESNDKC